MISALNSNSWILSKLKSIQFTLGSLSLNLIYRTCICCLLVFFKMKHTSSMMDAMDIVEEFVELGREVPRLQCFFEKIILKVIAISNPNNVNIQG